MSSLPQVVIVGTSLAGLRGAEELRRVGYRGGLALVGREPHFPPYDRPPLSKQVLAGKWTPEQARLREFERLDATVIPRDAATGLDLRTRTLSLESGRVLPWDGLMIATGASVRKLRCPGSDLPGVIYFRTIEDCVKLRSYLAAKPRIVAIGAGFIGSEIAAVCRQAGLDVTLIDAAPLPLQPQVGTMVAEFLMQQHVAHGVELRLGVGVAEIEGDEHAQAVRLGDGTRVEADLVIVGIGVEPAASWLEGSGLTIDNGVVCDEHCRAIGASDVVAAGDVARWHNPVYGERCRIEHWTNAVEQAEYAARALAGDLGEGYSPLPYFWSDQYDAHLQFAGRPGDEQELVDGSLADGKFVVECRAAGNVVGAIAVNSVARFARRRRSLKAMTAPSGLAPLAQATSISPV